MRHKNPRVQALVEALQGVIARLSDRRVVWDVKESFNGYTLECKVMRLGSPEAWWWSFTVGREAMDDKNYERFQKHLVVNVVLAFLKHVYNTSTPVPSADVIYVLHYYDVNAKEARP